MNNRLLAEEWPLCKAKTLYTFILKIELATEWATYAVSSTLSTYEAIPDQPSNLRRLAGCKNEANEANSAKNRKAAMRVVRKNAIV